MIKYLSKLSFLFVSLFIVFIINNCGSGGNGEDETACGIQPNISIEVCNPGNGPFSINITNPYLPFTVGDQSVLKGTEDGEIIRLRITVLDETETVAGIDTRVVEEREWEGGELIEVSRNFFVQAPDGTVCYYGEDVDIYEDGEIVSHEGAWLAWEKGNKPGIMMPGSPSTGQIYSQEFAPGIAQDTAEITKMGATITVPAGTFIDTITMIDTNPFDCEQDKKHYARDVGLIVDGSLRLISY